MWPELRAFLREPGPAPPPTPARFDRPLVLALVPAVIAEGALREGIPLRPLHIALGVAAVAPIAFRRSRPLLAVAFAFGLAILTTLAQRALSQPQVSLGTSIFVLLLPYSLLRWGSGRDVAIGVLFLAGAYVAAALAGEMHGIEEVIGAAVVMLFPAALGASVRFRADAHRREIEEGKLRERAHIARDLHDTVAHHVSAIAIQAQAARAVISMKPEAAARALEAIEAEASRTLVELRGMVHTLRDQDGSSLEPQPGVADIARLATRLGGAPRIDVELAEGLERLRPGVQSALYRVAQESITNAIRHARGATRVQVRVSAAENAVRLTVEDDGAAASAPAPSGMGIVGMTERAALLGGRLEAGPRRAGGWTVELVLPDLGEVP